jgi:ergothioneine biosynthesis protein EgtB
MTATLTATGAASLRERLEAAWRRSDTIFALLADAAWYERPIALRQPFIFYVGHLPAFGWNQVVRGLLGRPGFDETLDQLFARGIDPVGVDRYVPDSPTMWPKPEAVLAYRDRVREELRASFEAVSALEGTDVLADRGRVWQLVIEHELMHHETLLYMVQQLDRRLVRKPADMPAYRFEGGARAGRVHVPAGRVTLGAAFDDVPFGWDNEFPEQTEDVAAFAIDATPVRNEDWLAFMDARGYEHPELWTSDGWAWKERVKHQHPVFWKRDGASWRYLTLFDELPLEQVASWPVYVSWVEAAAYARWKGGVLPTEAEVQRAATGVRWGERSAGNYGFQNWAPVPVGTYPPSDYGVHGLVGNGWEWTRSVFAPFPGFTAWARTYPGYSADFFDGQHFVMLGASWATDEALVRRSFRNWFQPHYPYVFAKFRCAYRT